MLKERQIYERDKVDGSGDVVGSEYGMIYRIASEKGKGERERKIEYS